MDICASNYKLFYRIILEIAEFNNGINVSADW